MAKRESNIIDTRLERIGKKNFQSELNKNLQQITGHPLSVSSEVLPLPDERSTAEYQLLPSFGRVYVGESFSSCLTISNLTENVQIEALSVVANLAYSESKAPVLIFQLDLPRLTPRENKCLGFTLVIGQPLKCLLTLQIKYSLRDMIEPVTFRKQWRFEAKMPFEIKHKAIKGEAGIFLELRVQNITINPLHLDAVDFLPGQSVNAISLHDAPMSRVFNSSDVRAYLYQLIELEPSNQQVELGNLVLAWFNNTGDAGNLAFRSFTFNPTQENLLKVKLENPPTFFQLEVPVAIGISLTNASSNMYMEDVRIELENSLMRNVVLTPLDTLSVGRIPPKQSKTLQFCIFPKVPGIHKLEGMRVITGNKASDYEACSIFVQV